MIDDWMPAFAKLPKRREPEVDDPLKLDDKALSLDGLQAIYRNPGLPLTTRMRAMIAAIPFESPKLLATAIIDERDFATLLDRRLKRIQQQRLLENKTINHAVTETTTVAGPQPSPPLPNPLNRLYSSRFRRI
jgi:hypothetical protein